MLSYKGRKQDIQWVSQQNCSAIFRFKIEIQSNYHINNSCFRGICGIAHDGKGTSQES